MQPSATRPLKLRARDRGDLEVISALLQDALVPLVDVSYLPREKRFVLVANRFRWPEAERGTDAPVPVPPPPGQDASFADTEESPPFGRVNCGICFEVCPTRFDAVKKISGEPVPPPIPEDERVIVKKSKTA